MQRKIRKVEVKSSTADTKMSTKVVRKSGTSTWENKKNVDKGRGS
jgi:hypothetical protein